jgi:hypothetical protein
MAEVRLAKEAYDILNGYRLENIELKKQLAISHEENQVLRAKLASLPKPQLVSQPAPQPVAKPVPKQANNRPSKTIVVSVG